IVDATIVSAPKQRNTREENEAIKVGETPEGWETKPAKNAQKDKDARWTKKNEQSFYGYKNHISVDRKHKLIRRYAETDACVHDSQKLDEILGSVRTWARPGFRMIPPFPSSPLRCRTAVIPQYGSKAGFSDETFPPRRAA